MKTFIKFNINQTVCVKLTSHGKQILKDIDASRNLPARYTKMPNESLLGYSEWQLWDLMQTFGPHVGLGLPEPFETAIELVMNS